MFLNESRAVMPNGQFASISLLEILAWLELENVYDSQDRMDAVQLLRVLDLEWMSYHREKHDKLREEAEKTKRPKGR